jgi:hypothetical protein
MNAAARYASFAALALTFLAPLLFALGRLSDPAMKAILLAATVLWFLTAPRWMKGGE